MNMIRSIYKKLLNIVIRLLPTKVLYKLVYDIIVAKSLSSEAKKSLLNLFDLDNKLYLLQGHEAIRLDNGIHPKHRILKYKEWFYSMIGFDNVVLDVGCNTGLVPEILSNKASFVYGIEIEESYIKQAKKFRSKENIKFICGDATKYDYSKCKPIDCVTLSNVLEHIEDRVVFLKKLLLQVKWNDDSNKRFLIRVPMLDRDWRAVLKKELGCEWRLDSSHFTEYTKEEFYDEMSQSGIKVLSYDVRFGEIYADCRGEKF